MPAGASVQAISIAHCLLFAWACWGREPGRSMRVYSGGVASGSIDSRARSCLALQVGYYNWIMPRRTAIATAWVRSRAASFSRMCRKWALTVSLGNRELFTDIAIPIAARDSFEHPRSRGCSRDRCRHSVPAFGQPTKARPYGRDGVGGSPRPVPRGACSSRDNHAPPPLEHVVSRRPLLKWSAWRFGPAENCAMIAAVAAIPLMSGSRTSIRVREGCTDRKSLQRLTACGSQRDQFALSF